MAYLKKLKLVSKSVTAAVKLKKIGYNGERDEHGKRKGTGTLSYINGEAYEGKWENDMREGYGVYKFSDGSVYEGEWHLDFVSKGKYTFTDGDTFEGEFNEYGERHGKGEYRHFKSKDVFVGTYERGEKHGVGITHLTKAKIKKESKWVHGAEQLENVVLEYENGGHYKGGINHSSERSGYGVFRYPCGDIAKGEWKQNMLHGHAKIHYANGRSFEGNFENDKMNGYGKLKFSNGDLYEGEFLDDKMHGRGRAKFKSGEEYIGDFVNDMREGKGKCTFEDKTVYVGEWSAGEMHGKGKAQYASGSTFKGYFFKGLKSGPGKIIFADKGYFKGEFSADKKEGAGILKQADGTVIRGIWRDDQLVEATFKYGGENSTVLSYEGGVLDGKYHGSGELVTISGIYKGEFKNGKREGIGRFEYASGAVYCGSYLKDQKHGEGTFEVPDEGKYTGQWVNGVKCGFGRFDYADGGSYEGEWADDMKWGHGVAICGGSTYTGEYIRGKRHGYGRLVSASGTVYEGEFVNDRKNGVGTLTYPTGKSIGGVWVDDALREPHPSRENSPRKSPVSPSRQLTSIELALKDIAESAGILESATKEALAITNDTATTTSYDNKERLVLPPL